MKPYFVSCLKSFFAVVIALAVHIQMETLIVRSQIICLCGPHLVLMFLSVGGNSY